MPFSLMGCTVQMYHMEQYGVRYLDSNLLPMRSIECCLLLLTEEDPLLLFVSFYAHKSEDPGWGEIIGPDLYPHWQQQDSAASTRHLSCSSNTKISENAQNLTEFLFQFIEFVQSSRWAKLILLYQHHKKLHHPGSSNVIIIRFITKEVGQTHNRQFNEQLITQTLRGQCASPVSTNWRTCQVCF